MSTDLIFEGFSILFKGVYDFSPYRPLISGVKAKRIGGLICWSPGHTHVTLTDISHNCATFYELNASAKLRNVAGRQNASVASVG